MNFFGQKIEPSLSGSAETVKKKGRLWVWIYSNGYNRMEVAPHMATYPCQLMRDSIYFPLMSPAGCSCREKQGKSRLDLKNSVTDKHIYKLSFPLPLFLNFSCLQGY